jgi:hypothetical protein
MAVLSPSSQRLAIVGLTVTRAMRRKTGEDFGETVKDRHSDGYLDYDRTMRSNGPISNI